MVKYIFICVRFIFDGWINCVEIIVFFQLIDRSRILIIILKWTFLKNNFFSENVPRFPIEIAPISVEQGRDRLLREEFQSQAMRFAGKSFYYAFSWKMKLSVPH